MTGLEAIAVCEGLGAMAEFLDTVKRAAAAENRAEQVTAITPGLQQGRGDAIACRRRFPRHRARARAERAQLPQGDGVIAEIGRAHVRTPVTNAQLVLRLMPEKKH